MEAESAQGPQSTSSDADDDLISFAPGPGCLPNLLELCLDVGCMGITELVRVLCMWGTCPARLQEELAALALVWLMGLWFVMPEQGNI